MSRRSSVGIFMALMVAALGTAGVDGAHADEILSSAAEDSILIGGTWYWYSAEAVRNGLAELSAGDRQFCGDLNGNHVPDLGDITGAVAYLFGAGAPPADYDFADCDDHYVYTPNDLAILMRNMFGGGPPPVCFEEADVDVSIGLDVGDLVYLVNYMFKEGPAPKACFPDE